LELGNHQEKPGMRRLIHVSLLAVLCLASSAAGAEEKFLGKKTTAWISDLKSSKSSASARRAAAFALGKLGTDTYRYQGVEPLLARLGSDEKDAGVRAAAAYALGEIAVAIRKYDALPKLWKEANPSLTKALSEDKDPGVRRSAAYAIGGFGKAALPARTDLINALGDKSPPVRQNVAWALGQLGRGAGRDAVEGLSKMLEDEDASVRRDAAGALGEIGRLLDDKKRPMPSPAVQPLLAHVKGDANVVVRKTALDALERLIGPEDKEAAGDLKKMLDDKDVEIARGAAFALGNIGGKEAEEAVPVLRKALKDEDPHIREYAAAAMANIGEGAEPAVGDLTKALEDDTPRIRCYAALALGNIGKGAANAVPSLAKHLHPEEKDPEVRRYAAEALARMGDAMEDAVPDLVEAMQKDKVPIVRQKCVWALAFVKDLETAKAIGPLTKILDETDQLSKMVRYDAARVLAKRLRGEAPEKAVVVLLEMLNDKDVREYSGSGASVTGGGGERVGGTSLEQNLGRDARYYAIPCLALIGAPKAKRPDVIKALEQAAKSKDANTSDAAKEALKEIRGN
jgi:HEAT repeat protein